MMNHGVCSKIVEIAPQFIVVKHYQTPITTALAVYPVIDYRDTIHAAILKNNSINQIMSADKDFIFEFITRIDPNDYTPLKL